MLTEYSILYRFKNFCCVKLIAIDKEALESEREKLLNNSDYTRVDEIQESSLRGLTYQDLTSKIPGVDFVKGKAIPLGEMHTDSRCTGTRPLYTMPEFKDAAINEFKSLRKGQQSASDAYYSKPWV